MYRLSLEGADYGQFSVFLKSVLGNPVNSAVAVQSFRERKKLTDDIKSDLKKKLAKLEDYLNSLSSLNDKFTAELEPYPAKDSFEAIQKFSVTAIGQLKEKISEINGRELSEIESQNVMDRNNALKALELFLQNPGLQPDRSSVKVIWDNGAYIGSSSYSVSSSYEFEGSRKGLLNKQVKKSKEELSLKYGFQLTTSGSDLFSSILHFSSLGKGIKLPVKHAVSWISKEPVIDYEKLDRYDLAEAVLADGNLVATFRDTEKESEVRFTLTSYGESMTLDVDYKDSSQTVSITGQPALQNNIDIKQLEEISDTIRKSLLTLESSRAGLKTLQVDGDDILSTFNSIHVIKTLIKLGFVRFRIPQEDIESGRMLKKLEENEKILNERIRLLGDGAQEVASLLRLNVPA